jgi:hypothetical protein
MHLPYKMPKNTNLLHCTEQVWEKTMAKLLLICRYLHISDKRLVKSLCLSVCKHVTNAENLNGFPFCQAQ